MKKVIYILFLSTFIFANTLGVWSEISPISLESQHEKKYDLKDNGIWIIASDKDNTKLLNEYFKANTLPQNIDFIMDTTRIPSFLFDVFVLPKLQKYKHPILLSHDEEYNETLPYKEDFITILFIENKIVTRIEFIKDIKELEKFIK